MYFNFGKKQKAIMPPPPDMAGSSAFGRYLRYGSRRSLFGRRYFGKRIPQFGMHNENKMYFGASSCGQENKMYFGRRRKGSRKGARKGGRKVKKPAKALIRMCKKHGIKCTKKVGSRRVYKKTSVLKKQLRRKKQLHRKKKSVHRKKKSVRRTRRRYTLFGKRRRVSLFGFKV